MTKVNRTSIKQLIVAVFFVSAVPVVMADAAANISEPLSATVTVSASPVETVSRSDIKGFIAAVKLGQFARVEHYLAAGVDVNAMRENKYPAVFYASGKGYNEIMKALIAAGADINQLGRGRWTPLMAAALHNHRDNVSLLLANGAKLEAMSADGRTALMYAVAADRVEAVELLLSAKANVMAVVGAASAAQPQTEAMNVLAIAIATNHSDQVALLLRAGASVNAVAGGAPPLYYALIDNRLKIADQLIAGKADLGWRDRYGNSLLHRVVATADVATIDYLLAKGVDPSRANKQSETALMVAADSGKQENFQQLLALASTSERKAAFFVAAASGVTQAVDSLLQAGVDVNAVDNSGRTALMVATAYRHHVLVDRLLANEQINIDQQDTAGRTALMTAVLLRPEKLRVVEALLRAGADREVSDKTGSTALVLAVQNNVPAAVVQSLLAAGADQKPALGVLQRLRQEGDNALDQDNLALISVLLTH